MLEETAPYLRVFCITEIQEMFAIISLVASCCCSHDSFLSSRVVADLCVEIANHPLDVMVRHVIQHSLQTGAASIPFTFP